MTFAFAPFSLSATAPVRPQHAETKPCDYSIAPAVRKTIFHAEDRLVMTAGLPHSGQDLFNTGKGPWQRLETLAIAKRVDAYPMREREWIFHSRCEPDLLHNNHLRMQADRDRERDMGQMFCEAQCELRMSKRARVALLEPSTYPTPQERGAARLATRPDVTFAARAAEAAGVDLRVLVLSRPAAQIMVRFGAEVGGADVEGAPARAAVLLSHCKSLESQLRAVDARFLSCGRYHSLTGRLSGLSGPNVSALGPFANTNAELSAALNKIPIGVKPRDVLKSRDVLNATLETKLLALDECIERIEALAHCDLHLGSSDPEVAVLPHTLQRASPSPPPTCDCAYDNDEAGEAWEGSYSSYVTEESQYRYGDPADDPHLGEPGPPPSPPLDPPPEAVVTLTADLRKVQSELEQARGEIERLKGR